jgi:hypothetical protein
MPKGFYKRSEEQKEKLRRLRVGIPSWNKGLVGYLANENNPKWAGDNVSYSALHNWINSHHERSSNCNFCGNSPGKNKLGYSKIQWANISKKYSRERGDWLCLCPSCHKNYDNKNNKQNKYSRCIFNKKITKPRG